MDKSPTYLFSVQIPDKANKQYLFQNPHSQAPKMYAEAVKREDSTVWMEVMEIELTAMQDLDVWEVTPRSRAPLNIKPMSWKWVYTYKENGAVKARLVVVGSLGPSHTLATSCKLHSYVLQVVWSVTHFGYGYGIAGIA